MNRSRFLQAIFAAVLAVVTCSGCQNKSPDAAGSNAAKAAQPTPESTFAAIVETFRRGVEEVPIGFVVQDSSGVQSMMTGKNVVTHKLLPPEKEGDPLRAQITVTSDTQYSLQRSIDKPGGDDSDQSASSATEDSTGGGSDVQIFDPSVASAPGGTERRTTSGNVDTNAVTVARTDNKYERIYELVYENGLWKLITKLDPKTEESIKVAFDRALESQS